MNIRNFLRSMVGMLLLSLHFFSPSPAHGDGEVYVGAYNELMRMLIDRRLAAGMSVDGLFPRSPGDPLSQGDLNVLRTNVIAMMSGAYVVVPATPLGSTTDEAFPYGLSYDTNGMLRFPSLMEGIGNNGVFTKVPANLMAGGQAIYSNDFQNIPLLWIHFDELHRALSRMTDTRKTGAWADPAYYGWASLNKNLPWSRCCSNAQAALYPSGASALCNYMQGNKNTTEWTAYCEKRRSRYYISGISTSLSKVVYFYCYAVSVGEWNSEGTAVVEDSWYRWDTQGDDGEQIISAYLGPSTKLDCCTEPPPSGTTACGFCVTAVAAVIRWTNLYVGSIVNPAQNDSAYDGLAYAGCQQCPGSASSCPILPTVSWKDGPNNGGQAKFPLGVSSPLTNGGLGVRAYIEEYSVGGSPQQMFSLDTRVLSHTSDTNEGWEFVTVKRPSGAEVVFSLKGSSKGRSINIGQNYVASVTTNDEVEIIFPASGNIVHRFDNTSGKIAEVYPKANRSLSIHGSSSQWPGMTTYRDGNTILSNDCPLVIAQPTNSGGLITGITYKDHDGTVIANLSVLPGSRIYKMTDGSGNLMDETHYLSNPTNHTDEIWYGVTTNPSLSVAKKVIRQESFNASNMLATLTEKVILNPDTANASSNVTLTVSEQFLWGQEPLSVTTGYGSSDPQTTFYTWYTNAADTGSCGRLQLVENPDRSWSKYQYNESGRESLVLTPFESAGPDSATNECRVTRNYYVGDSILSSLNFPSDVTFANDQRPRLVVEGAAGYEVSRTYSAYFADYAVTKRCQGSGAAYDDASNLVSITYFYTNGVGNGRVQRIEHANGTLTTYSYDYDSGVDQLTTTEDTGAGTTSVTNGTRTITVRNASDLILSTTTRDIASDILVSSVTNTYDNRGRIAVSSNAVSGAASESTYACCDTPESVLDTDGILTEYAYDDLKQIYSSARLGVTTYFSYDESGHITATRKSASGVDDVVTASVYDKSGRLTASTNELGNVTAYSYATSSSGERIVTSTYPDNSTRIETYYRDGRLKSVDGSAEHARFYDYGVDGDGAYTIEYQGSNSSASAWVKTSVNLVGQTWKTAYPDSYTRTTAFDSHGRVFKEGDGLTTTLTEYDGNSEPYRTAVDMNGNDAVDLTGNDRITETLTDHATFDSKDVRETTTRVYPAIGSSTPLVASIQRRAVDDSVIWSIVYGRTNRTDISRNAGTASRIETTTQPDGTQVVSYFTNSLLMAVVRKASGGAVISTTTYGYDPFGRQNFVSEPAANGQTRTTAVAYDATGNTTSTVVSAGALTQSTSYQYDSMNRRTKATLPDGGEVNYSFTQKGELSGQNGARTYPVTYAYDGQGRMETLSTYRNGLSGSADVTSWQYDSQRGWLTAKIFADGTSNSYQYLQNGLLGKRTWARGIDTEYGFDAAGALTNVNYSDSTPDVTYSLDRLGRAVEITDGIGTRTNAYLADGQLESVTLPQQIGWQLAYGHDAFNRMTNIAMRDQASSVQRQALYAYDNAGRIGSVGDGTHTAIYSYGPDGSTWTNLSYGGPLNVQRTFDGLGHLTQISNLPSNGPPISFSYSYNQADQRTTNALADGSHWVYTYDSLGQVVSGKKYFLDGVPVGGTQFEYEFDTIGNRKTAKNLMGTSSLIEQYTANELNQYESRTVPGKILVTGEVATNATVNVRFNENSTAKLANRHGGYFWQVLNTDNTSALVATTNLQVRAFMTVVQGPNTNSLVRAETREEIVPQTPEPFSYDADGNLLSDGRWLYSWDAENRLTNVESIVDVPDSLKRKLAFGYDHQSRRTMKTVYSGFDGVDYAVTNITEFVWDGWLPIAELSVAFTNFMTWGIDLSGALQGVGGVGGLVAMNLNGANCFSVYDGNGNVMALVSAAGAVLAGYEYSAFGDVVRQTGSQAANNHFRFSTKYTDPETKLAYCGFRYYDPKTGRWLGRDPIGERGGINLFGFVRNRPTMAIDPLGLYTYTLPKGDCNVSALFAHSFNVTTGPGGTLAPPPGGWGNCSYAGFFSCAADNYNIQIPPDHRLEMPSIPDSWPGNEQTGELSKDIVSLAADLSGAWCSTLQRVVQSCKQKPKNGSQGGHYDEGIQEPDGCGCQKVTLDVQLDPPSPGEIRGGFQKNIDFLNSRLSPSQKQAVKGSCSGLPPVLNELWGDGFPRTMHKEIECKDVR